MVKYYNDLIEYICTDGYSKDSKTQSYGNENDAEKREYIRKNFLEFWNRNKDKFIDIQVSEEKINKIREFAEKLVEYKTKNENIHCIDGKNEVKRWVNGLMGEAALEQLLGLDIIDYSIGKSKDYNKPDIEQLGMGIKTSQFGQFPLVEKSDAIYPQVICIKDNYVYGLIHICGVAHVDVLNKNKTDDLVFNQDILKAGYKTAFYGYDELGSVENLMVKAEKYKLDSRKLDISNFFGEVLRNKMLETPEAAEIFGYQIIDGEVYKIEKEFSIKDKLEMTKSTADNEKVPLMRKEKELEEII